MKNVLILSWIILIACTNQTDLEANLDPIVPKTATSEEFVKIWNDLINQRDWEKLEKLYAPEIFNYGKKKTRAFCITSKQRYMEAHSNFDQKVENIGGNPVYYNAEDVTFEKSYLTSSGLEKTVWSVLSLVKNENGDWKIRSETDFPTSRKTKEMTSCNDFWRQLIRTNKEIGEYAASRQYSIEMYFNEDLINLHIRDNGGHGSATIDTYVFSIKEEELYQTSFKMNYKEGKIVPYDKSIYKRLEEFCR